GLLAIGTLIALLPDTVFAFAVARVPREAATATLLLLSLALSGVPAHAQHVVDPESSELTVSTPEERAVARKLACWCGGCPKHPVGECECSHCRSVRSEIGTQLKSGMTEDEVLAY